MNPAWTPMALALMCATLAPSALQAWGAQGHRLVALVATDHSTSSVRQNIAWLLGDKSLADISGWADDYKDGNAQTSAWHFVNIPLDAARYDRTRDCPRQPGVSAGSPSDKWRDCVVDRILYNQERLANDLLDRADRAIALKFLVHLVGDLHQPFHALGVERGGNDIPVSVFGSETCGDDAVGARPCNLHGVWDGALIAHRHLSDRQYLAALEENIRQNRWEGRPPGVPAEWAMQSRDLAKTALLPRHGDVNETYYRAQISVVDERLALGGLRLAALLNKILTKPPPAK